MDQRSEMQRVLGPTAAESKEGQERLRAESQNLDENISGADYLRMLRQTHQAPSSSEMGSPATGGPGKGSTGQGVRERRRSPRYRCEGSVQFRAGEGEAQTWGTLTDISLSGCYVEMSATFPVGTVLQLLLTVNNIRVQARGRTRTVDPFLGNGIEFTQMAGEDRSRLQEIVDKLAAVARKPAETGSKPHPR